MLIMKGEKSPFENKNRKEKISFRKTKTERRLNRMAKKGGFPGGGIPGNMGNLMKQAQRMQKQMEEKTKELEDKEWEASAGGGAVTVKVSGKKEISSVKLSKEVVDPDDIEMLEDLIVAAANEALRKMEEESSEVMGQVTGGLGGGLGGLGGFPF
jgi:DNA-binding YbaB/EbfC family protein